MESPFDGVAEPGRPELSVTEPLSRAYAHTRRMLVPFNAGKWLTLGVTAWLASLGEGGGSFTFPDTSGGSGGTRPILRFLEEHLALVTVIGISVLLVGLVVGLVLLWLNTRGRFMFTDNVLYDRALVEEPWRRYREHSWRLFRVRAALMLVSFVIVLLAAAVGIGIAYEDLEAGRFGRAGALGLVAAVVILLFTLPLSVVAALFNDFVLAAMVIHGPDARQGWERTRAALTGRVGEIVLFYLVRALLGVAFGVVVLLATCATCCIAALPFVGTVLLLPAYVFLRAYVLFFVQQLGPGWELFPAEGPEEPWRDFGAPT